MASYEVLIKPSAAKELEALPLKQGRQVVKPIRTLASSPRLHGAEKLAGSECWRIRQGDYRVVYDIDDSGLRVIVLKIGHRREVYR